MKKTNVIKTDSSSLADSAERISKISIYLLVFLLPILFLPWTANILEFNKQALLIVLVLISFFSWLFKILVSGRARINLTIAYIPPALLMVVYGASSIFSRWRFGSFWGWPLVTAESLVNIIFLFLLFVLIMNVFEKKELHNLIYALMISSSVAFVYLILQLLGMFLIPIGFTKSISFNTVGGPLAAGVFASAMLPISIVLLTLSKKKYMILAGLTAAASFVSILILNFPAIWWLVAGGCALVFAFAVQRRDIFDSRWAVLPMTLLAVSLLFAFFKFSIPGIPLRPAEFFLKQGPSIEIARETLKSNPVFGTGPGTFTYAFSKYRDAGFNQGSLWDYSFEWSGSKFLTVLTTVGITGALAFLVFIVFFAYAGILLIIKNRDEGSFSGSAAALSFLALSAGFFLFNSATVLEFLFFFLAAILAGFVWQNKKEFVLKSSSLSTLIFTFLVTVIFVFGLGILVLEGQRYASSASYFNGMKEWQEGKTENAIKNIERAASISPQTDIYLRELSQAYLKGITETVQSGISQDEKAKKIQIYVNKTVNSAKSATDANPNNPANWSARGFAYQSLIGVVPDTRQWAEDSYKKAIELDPVNPYYPSQAGISLLKEAGLVKDNKEKLLAEAMMYFEKSIELKLDYAQAHFQMARIFSEQGRTAEMISSLEKAGGSDPNDPVLAYQLGLVYYQKKDYERAKKELERAVVLRPAYSNALYFLGICYYELNNKDVAIAVFRKILELNPGNDIATKVLDNMEHGKKALSGLEEEDVPEESS
ncbi:MAG: hypothetical protein A2365_00960 [Candidatus Nealsonbacteria bacterium RIFOXYB1_FULL_40_15]|uniref:UDP-N-acetylglucosamine--peptide N-acetylglucosaminyltransferase SPINDLY n=2 Tax=Candidatus Nealsoniibacteriota TaxID=1817911 RepID=A0A1G2ESV6_9BACT|nr:MAG: hypothetical protein A2365_00960 [Candidatus Nealsonbacteria bacterium RIFOXYB1_FULL_40_15]OGZ28876.1 MAG: hypothetical protein A2427_01390 [Candidatus Nealsonbacteria bacterium RIFOXYC1_FULL_40_7]OGZ29130.1 MAG: hypothetical protein A2562_00755 [Candidatus Nealsonbacteria bacterium RIFOXYD1_FULL_39_11]